MRTHTLHKSERLCSRKAVEALFNGGARGFTVWPLRAVFKQQGANNAQTCPAATGADAGNAPAASCTQVLFVAPKRRLRHAVDRNRAKRQMREAYRLQKHVVTVPVHLALVWIADCAAPSHRVHEAVRRILCRVAESVN